jgi:hypothetical protein
MRVAAGLAIAVAVAVLAACGGSSDGGMEPPAAAPATPEDAGRQRAPAIMGISLDGEPISLEDFRGEPVLVNVWSSW